MDVRHLRVLLAVVDAGGFSAAATRLHVAQSSLSRTVAELERRVGVRLLERTTRRVHPTAEGEQVIALARHTVAEVDRALAHLDGYLQGSRGSVSLAALPSLAACLLPPVLAEYRRERPDVALTVVDGLARQVEVMVGAGEVDFAVSSRPPDVDRLVSIPIATDRFYALCPPGHAWVGRESVAWAELAGSDFVQFTAQSSIRTLVDDALLAGEVSLGRTTQASSVVSVAGLVAAGAGVTVVPALVGPLTSFSGAHLVPLVEPVLTRQIWVVRDPLRPLSRAALALLEVITGARERGLVLPAGCAWVGRARDAKGEECPTRTTSGLLGDHSG